MDLKQLLEPMPYQWKIQSWNREKTKACCVAYIDARDAMRKLDSVCGPDNWKDRYYEAMGQLFCEVSIKVNADWVGKSDSGIVTADTEKVDLEMTQKGSASDAFKRACVKWGIGRFLYDLDMVWLDKETYDANRWNLTDYINSKKAQKVEAKPAAKVELPWMNEHQLADLLKLISEGKYDGKNGQEVVRLARQKYAVNKEMAAKIDHAVSLRVGNY
jgi:hypothetical protein